MTRDDALTLLTRFCTTHSPAGYDREIDPLAQKLFAEAGYACQRDTAGNVFAIRPGYAKSSGVADDGVERVGRVIVTAHKDELAVVVKRIEFDGRLQVRPVGAVWPWSLGEGPMDVLGDDAIVSGILSFGSRHTSAESAEFAARSEALTWEMAWIETYLTPRELDEQGVHVGSKAVVARSRKTPLTLGDHVCAYGLDDRIALVALFDLVGQLAEETLRSEVIFALTANEELGGTGASWLVARHPADVMVALEVAPVADEYQTLCDDRPVLIASDDFGPYDDRVIRQLATAAGNLNLGVQYAALSAFSSDASFAAQRGGVARPASVGFAAQNTHGYEIAHLGIMDNMAQLVAEWLRGWG